MKSANFKLPRARRTLTQVYRFLRYASVCRTDFLSVFGRIGQGQQPVWGVGRLCLSVIGIAEPHFGNRNDSRLFVFIQNFVKFFVELGRNSGNFIEGEMHRCIRDLFNEKNEPLQMQNAPCRNPRNMVCNRMRDNIL